MDDDTRHHQPLPTDPTLQLYLLLRVTVAQRLAEPTRLAVRRLAEHHDDRTGMRVLSLLRRTIPPDARQWLSTI